MADKPSGTGAANGCSKKWINAFTNKVLKLGGGPISSRINNRFLYKALICTQNQRPRG